MKTQKEITEATQEWFRHLMSAGQDKWLGKCQRTRISGEALPGFGFVAAAEEKLAMCEKIAAEKIAAGTITEEKAKDALAIASARLDAARQAESALASSQPWTEISMYAWIKI